jgi:uncharacterized protein with von Willebrand factor type A (vWA) domain
VLHLLRIVTHHIVTIKTVTTRIPEDDEKALAELEAEMSADQSEVLRQLIRQGFSNWHQEKVLDELRDHTTTVRKAQNPQTSRTLRC